ncbi:MAG TPA: AI-2E family transporter [Ktedonobacteraceae bacterium]
MERVNWQRIRDILISLICIGILFWTAWSIMSQFVHAIILLLLAMAIAFLVTPLVNFLHRSMPRALAALLVFVVIMAVLGGFCYALIFSLIQQISYFANNLPSYFNNLPATYTSFLKWLLEQGVSQGSITNALNQLQNQVTLFLQNIVTNALNIVFFVTDILVNILLIVVLSFYLTVDGKRIRNAMVSIAPKSSLPHVLLFEDALNRVVGNYIRGQLTLALIIGILSGIGCWVFQLGNYALIVGVMAFLFETIPMVGPALASIPALLISLLLPEPFPRTLWVLIYFIVVQMVESNILGPRIVGHAVGLHPVASILALVIGAQLFGAFGALLATPIVAASWVVIASLYNSIRGESADTMLATRRGNSQLRKRKSNVTSSGFLIDNLHSKSPPEPLAEVRAAAKNRQDTNVLEDAAEMHEAATNQPPISPPESAPAVIPSSQEVADEEKPSKTEL